jgi:hypothetical protein
MHNSQRYDAFYKFTGRFNKPINTREYFSLLTFLPLCINNTAILNSVSYTI